MKPVSDLLLVALCSLTGLLSFSQGAEDKAFASTVELRDSLANSRFQFETSKKGNVAFMGGSITEMNGYRPLVCEILKKRFPGTEFTFTNAGIASTCSNTGAFRLERDVLSTGPVDLLFVEFAVNDDQDGHFSKEECIRGMEGIIRHARLQNPNIDIVMTFFVNEGMIKKYQEGKVPLSIESHDTVAKAYGISTINVAKELTDEIGSNSMTWQQYGGVHPAAPGADLCARMITGLFQRAWDAPAVPISLVNHSLPPAPLDPESYFAGKFVDPKLAQVKSGWTYGIPDWSKEPKAGVRPQFKDVPMLSATEAGAEVSLEFEGTAVAAHVVSGPDSGIVEVSVDGKRAHEVNLAIGPCAALYYPSTVMLETGLPPGKHLLTLKMSDKTSKPGTTGNAMRIVQFGVN